MLVERTAMEPGRKTCDEDARSTRQLIQYFYGVKYSGRNQSKVGTKVTILGELEELYSDLGVSGTFAISLECFHEETFEPLISRQR